MKPRRLGTGSAWADGFAPVDAFVDAAVQCVEYTYNRIDRLYIAGAVVKDQYR